MLKKKKISVAIAGSTHRTVQSATALLNNPEFTIPWIITPQPKPIGRKKIITENPVDKFAQSHSISRVLLQKKIDAKTKQNIEKIIHHDEQRNYPDFVLVVDFGYIIPKWLLNLPKIAPINIHPSLLPRWRGSSPGQFCLLFGDKTSAVTVIQMNSHLDQGPIVFQQQFAIDPAWNSDQYYTFSFNLLSEQLPKIITNFAKNPSQIISQPKQSPTFTARRIKKQDAFIEWSIILHCLEQKNNSTLTNYDPIQKQNISQKKELLQNSDPDKRLLELAWEYHRSWPITLEHATRAFSSWPHLWTIIPTKKGNKRMKILSCSLEKSTNQWNLDIIQIEGQQAATWNQVKNQLLPTD